MIAFFIADRHVRLVLENYILFCEGESEKWWQIVTEQSTVNKIIIQTVEQVFFLHGHANIIEQKEYLVWRRHSISH
jgi:hypothetical protein